MSNDADLQHMDFSKLPQQIKSAGLHPIRIAGEVDRDSRTGPMFVGSLEEFLEAAKAFESKVVLVSVSKLEEEDFRSESDSYSDEEEDEDSGGSRRNDESFDLTVALPALAEFKKHLGKEGAFLLTAKSQLGALCYHMAETWWSSFQEQRDKAILKLEENAEAIREKMEQQELLKQETLLKQTRSLLSDPEFSRIPTQRGMKAYALEKFPELEAVEEYLLVQEIQKLSDKVKAKKRR